MCQFGHASGDAAENATAVGLHPGQQSPIVHSFFQVTPQRAVRQQPNSTQGSAAPLQLLWPWSVLGPWPHLSRSWVRWYHWLEGWGGGAEDGEGSTMQVRPPCQDFWPCPSEADKAGSLESLRHWACNSKTEVLVSNRRLGRRVCMWKGCPFLHPFAFHSVTENTFMAHCSRSWECRTENKTHRFYSSGTCILSGRNRYRMKNPYIDTCVAGAKTGWLDRIWKSWEGKMQIRTKTSILRK